VRRASAWLMAEARKETATLMDFHMNRFRLDVPRCIHVPFMCCRWCFHHRNGARGRKSPGIRKRSAGFSL